LSRTSIEQSVIPIEKMPDRRPVSLLPEQRLLGREAVRLKGADSDHASFRSDAKAAIKLFVGDEQPGLRLLGAIVRWPTRIRIFVLGYFIRHRRLQY
jgi:hypothetical protein